MGVLLVKRLLPYMLALGILAGVSAALVGLYGLLGRDWTLLVGGVALVVACVLVDV